MQGEQTVRSNMSQHARKLQMRLQRKFYSSIRRPIVQKRRYLNEKDRFETTEKKLFVEFEETSLEATDLEWQSLDKRLLKLETVCNLIFFCFSETHQTSRLLIIRQSDENLEESYYFFVFADIKRK